MRDNKTDLVRARIASVAIHVPEAVLSNSELAALFPDWSDAKILDKTGISERRVAGQDETAGDLAFAAAEALFAQGKVARDDIDFVILCTQAPDYILPTTACVLQERLGLRRDTGALDINLGCSGFVYALALASGMISAGFVRNVLLLTADTYSKYIHRLDKSVRTLFGDGAAATLIVDDSNGASTLGPFVFGTDGRGANDLIVESGGFRTQASPDTAREETDSSGNVRSRDNLYMNGAAIMAFGLREVPRTFEKLLELSGLDRDLLDYVVLHQANKFMVDALQKKLRLNSEQVPRYYEEVGNTVSSTIPFVLHDLIRHDMLKPGSKLALIGFGVGFSWAAAAVSF